MLDWWFLLKMGRIEIGIGVIPQGVTLNSIKKSSGALCACNMTGAFWLEEAYNKARGWYGFDSWWESV